VEIAVRNSGLIFFALALGVMMVVVGLRPEAHAGASSLLLLTKSTGCVTIGGVKVCKTKKKHHDDDDDTTNTPKENTNTPNDNPANGGQNQGIQKQVTECYTFPFIKGQQAYQAPFVDKCQNEYKGTKKCDGTFESAKVNCCCTYFK
jgi:hypothetical protein